MLHILYILFLVLLADYSLYAQSEHRSLINGNSFFQKKDFNKAAVEYEKALQVNKNSVKGLYNLGNTRYETKEFDKAIEYYKAAAETAENDNIKANAYHNLGNAFINKKKYQEAVDAYKNSLRLNPQDIETKYNLAQAMKKIQKNQSPPQPNNKENEYDFPPPPNETPKDELDRIMEMMDNEDMKTQENKKKQPSKNKKPEKDW